MERKGITFYTEATVGGIGSCPVNMFLAEQETLIPLGSLFAYSARGLEFVFSFNPRTGI